VAWLGALQWLKLLVLSAFTLLVASYARTSLFAIGTGFLGAVGCHLQHFAVAAVGRAGMPAAMWVLRLVPDFQIFEGGELIGAGLPAAGQIARIAGYASAHVALACGLAVICFERREV
jgi:hypothetical protein